MVNNLYYIQSPHETKGVTLIYCKTKRNKHVSVFDVPAIYRKDSTAKLRNWFYNAKEDIKFFIRRIKNDY